jgi:hypothetical protein
MVASMRIMNTILLAGAILAGCGRMMTGPDAMRGAVGDAVDEDQQHLTAGRTVASLPAMLDEVDRHTSRMTAIMDDMRMHMASMQHCSSIESMMDVRHGMRMELDAHVATMHAETDLVEASAEVEDHVGTMGRMLGDMGSILDGTHCSGW